MIPPFRKALYGAFAYFLLYFLSILIGFDWGFGFGLSLILCSVVGGGIGFVIREAEMSLGTAAGTGLFVGGILFFLASALSPVPALAGSGFGFFLEGAILGLLVAIVVSFLP